MKFYIVDCFAEEKYQGNELLVLKADRPVSDEEQQKSPARSISPRRPLSFQIKKMTADMTSVSGRQTSAKSPLPATLPWAPLISSVIAMKAAEMRRSNSTLRSARFPWM